MMRFDKKACTDGIERVKLKMFVGGSSSVIVGKFIVSCCYSSEINCIMIFVKMMRFDEKACTDGIERVKLKLFVGGSSSVYCGIGF